MGNHTSTNPKAVVHAAGKFKYAIVNKQTDTDDAKSLIRCVVNSYFKKKNLSLNDADRFDHEYEVLLSDDGAEDKDQPAILKYLTRHKGAPDTCDTRVAWNALRMATHQEQDSGHTVNRLKKLSDAIRFTRRVNPVHPEVVHYERNEPLGPRETFCDLCKVNQDDSALLPCRLCTKVYHKECLDKRGFLSDALQKEAVHLADTEIGWSCPSCESLFWLLSDVEKINLMEMFDEIDTNHDSLISRQEYLEFYQERHKDLQDIASCGPYQQETFDAMDRDGSGVVDWWEFLTPMCINILMKKTKDQLLEMLVTPEILKIKRYFRAYDPLGKGRISSRDARLAFKQWYISLINRPAFNIPLCEWLGGNRAGEEDALQLITTTVSWKQFLKRYAIFILAARPNTASTRPYIPRLDKVSPEHDDYSTRS